MNNGYLKKKIIDNTKRVKVTQNVAHKLSSFLVCMEKQKHEQLL